MGRIYDQDEEFDDDGRGEVFELDDSQLYCPKCGAQHTVKVTRWPQPGTWMNMNGQAECSECKIRFEIRIELPREEPQPGELDIFERYKQHTPWYGRR